jgi:hypothetical protein
MDLEWQHFMDRIMIRLKQPESNMKVNEENIMAGKKCLNTMIRDGQEKMMTTVTAIWSTQDDHEGFHNEIRRTRWKQKMQLTGGDTQVWHRGTGNTAT